MPQANDTRVRVNIPDIATKKLRFRKNGDQRILTISSNSLSMFGFEKGDAVIETKATGHRINPRVFVVGAPIGDASELRAHLLGTEEF